MELAALYPAAFNEAEAAGKGENRVIVDFRTAPVVDTLFWGFF